jgi:shikimate kinase
VTPRPGSMKLDKHVFLIGFSGSGKSTVGPMLARQLGVRFLDTDVRLAQEQGRSIPAIFAAVGEKGFRRLESRLIKRLVMRLRTNAVIALGGGAFNDPRNRKLAAEFGLSVYLSCSVREIYRRLSGQIDRPLLELPAGRCGTLRQARLRRIAALLASRKANYRCADIVVSSSHRSARETVREIGARIRTHVCPK